MEVHLVLNGALQKGLENATHPPKVVLEHVPETFNIDYNWSIEVKPTVILKGAREVEMTRVKEIESIRG